MSAENSEENLKKSLVISVYCFHSVKGDARWSTVSVRSGMWIKIRRLKQKPSGVRPQIRCWFKRPSSHRQYKMMLIYNKMPRFASFWKSVQLRTRDCKYFTYFNVCHPEVFNTYINIQWCISQTQQKFIMLIIVLGQHVSILIESSSGPSKIQILTLIGPEDDSTRIEICWPNTIINIIKFLLCLADTSLYIYIRNFTVF